MDFSDFGAKVEDNATVADLRKTVQSLVYNGGYHRPMDGLPSANPTGLSKRDFEVMKTTKYWISEKSDGQRCMMLSMPKGIYLIDGPLNFYFIDMTLPSNDDKHQVKTLLDGEIVYNHFYRKYCFMIFDVISVGGRKTTDENLTGRLGYIRDIVTLLRKKYKEDDDRLPFVILGKEFFPLEKLDWLLTKIQHYSDEEGDRYVYEHRNRFNENDGIIFTPDGDPYKPGRSLAMKKWKWPQLNTVDFLLKVVTKHPNSKIFKLYVGGPNNQHMEYKQVYFQEKCKQRLLHDLQDNTEAVIECAYSREYGEWQYTRLRNDKLRANYVTVVLQGMEANCDNVDAEALKRGLLSNYPPKRVTDNSNQKRPSSSGATSASPSPLFTPTMSTLVPNLTPSFTPDSILTRSEDNASPEYTEVVYDSPLEKSRKTPVLSIAEVSELLPPQPTQSKSPQQNLKRNAELISTDNLNLKKFKK